MIKKNGSVFRIDKRMCFSNLKMIIYGRTLIIVLAFLLQFMILYEGYAALSKYSFLVYIFFVFISAATVIYIFNRKGNPDMKLSWMLPITVFPVFGCVVYVAFILQPWSKIRRNRMQQLSRITGSLLAPGEAAERLREESPHMGQLAYYLYSRDNSPTYDGTTAEYYALGDAMFPAMLEELRKARYFIFLEYFIVNEGTMWDALHEVLFEKAQSGVEVRILIDGTNVLFDMPNFYRNLLEKEGIKCRLFAPIKPIFSNHYNNRDHRKLMIVDGNVAFTGGINIADEYINRRERFGHWKDTGIKLTGKAVDRLSCMFLEMWNSESKGEDDFRLYIGRSGMDALTDGYVIPYGVTPLSDERVGEQVYLEIIDTAHTYVHIASPYLVPDYRMQEALSYAAKRGVEVVLILPGIPDKKYTYALAKSYYKILLEAGVKIGEYAPGFVHAKMMIADDTKAVIGTVNLDYRSLYHHFECGVALYRNSQIVVMEQDMQKMLKDCIMQDENSLTEVDMKIKLFGSVLRLVAPLI